MARPIALVDGEFVGTGSSAPVVLKGKFNVSLAGFGSATVELQRSFDDGATWRNRKTFSADAEEVLEEPERDVQYRLSCTSFAVGPVAYRLSQ